MNEHCRDLHRKFYMKVNMKRIIFKKCVSFGNNGYSHVTYQGLEMLCWVIDLITLSF